MQAIDIKPDFDEARYRELLAPLIDGSRDHITFNTVHRHREGFDIPVGSSSSTCDCPAAKRG